MKTLFTLVPLMLVLHGCATTGGAIPDGAEPLSTEEIVATFSGVRESYSGRDNPAVSATGTFKEGGAFEASWSAGSQGGRVTGQWYAEDGKRCLRTTSASGGNVDLECHEMYRTGDVYTSLNDDGSVHGVHSLTPLE